MLELFIRVSCLSENVGKDGQDDKGQLTFNDQRIQVKDCIQFLFTFPQFFISLDKLI